ncbi:hypothetical protein C8J56DRAFT_1039464 [Mycena floridula]|nr:hypothetical protein C8J56DRAFT_1039464 [Mycena floridula]
MHWKSGGHHNFRIFTPRAIQALLEASLLEHRGTTFFVLPVIRSYIRDYSRCSSGVHRSMIQAACYFLQRHNSTNFGNPNYRDHHAARSGEEINLQTVLLTTRIPSTDMLRALLTLARHQKQARLEGERPDSKIETYLKTLGAFGYSF